jgi:hypothetical protein
VSRLNYTYLHVMSITNLTALPIYFLLKL